MLQKPTKKQIFLALFILISTTILPMQLFGVGFYLIPTIYVSFVAPFLIWKLLFKEHKLDKSNHVIWKVLLVLGIALCMLHWEMANMFLPLVINDILSKHDFSFGLLYAIFFVLQLIVHVISYSMMMFVWDTSLCIRYRKHIYWGIVIYCLLMGYWEYRVYTSPDTDTPETGSIFL